MASIYEFQARLTTLLNTPGVENIPVQNLSSGEIVITAVGPNPLDVVKVVFDRRYQTLNLLHSAPVSWWVNSPDLRPSIQKGWLAVLDPNASLVLSSSSLSSSTATYIPLPASPTLGDLLVWNGTAWSPLNSGTSGYVLTSNGVATIPSYQPVGGGGGAGDVLTLTGQTTAGLTDGDICYVSGNNTWLLARSDGTRQQATAHGAFAGTAGTMPISGRIAAAKVTTDGGSPTPGLPVYLAASTDDGGTGTGKVTATQPTTGFLTEVGVCLSNADYATLKTSVVLLNPKSPVQL